MHQPPVNEKKYRTHFSDDIEVGDIFFSLGNNKDDCGFTWRIVRITPTKIVGKIEGVWSSNLPNKRIEQMEELMIGRQGKFWKSGIRVGEKEVSHLLFKNKQRNFQIETA